MHPAIERVRAALAAASLDVEVVEFAESTRTAAEAAAAIGTTPARIVKSLVFLAGHSPVLVLASGANRVDTRKLAAACGQPVKRADAEQARAATGYVIGGTPPVGHTHPLPTYVDADLLAYDRVWAAAGTPNAVFAITPVDLVRLTAGRVLDLRADDEPAGSRQRTSSSNGRRLIRRRTSAGSRPSTRGGRTG